MRQSKYVLLDDSGAPIRYYDYPATGTVEIKEPTYTYDQLLSMAGECLL